MKTRAFGRVWGFGDGKICSILKNKFLDFLSYEGIGLLVGCGGLGMAKFVVFLKKNFSIF